MLWREKFTSFCSVIQHQVFLEFLLCDKTQSFNLPDPIFTSFQHFFKPILGLILSHTSFICSFKNLMSSAPHVNLLTSFFFLLLFLALLFPLQLTSHSNFCLSVNSSTTTVYSPRLETSVTFSLLTLYTHFITKSYQIFSHEL